MKNPDMPEATETPITAAGSSLLPDALADAGWPLLVIFPVLVGRFCEEVTVKGTRKVAVVTEGCSVLEVDESKFVFELDVSLVSVLELELELDDTGFVVVGSVVVVVSRV